MKRWVLTAAATALVLFVCGSWSFAGARHAVGPPGKETRRTVQATKPGAPAPHLHRFQKIGPRHTIIPLRYRMKNWAQPAPLWVGRS